ncbi:ferric reductase-like transmembrane domain-containing protein [Herminiimonas sp. CN]|uniref:ferredoxin reductase family protein n=1 Tax=Herminiimonas sp. CN TaxID=1349818 RepID=UPI000473FA19|nr:ferric reductase-like transmembrane domain-containing protein [Herminiimonas sp. CN]
MKTILAGLLAIVTLGWGWDLLYGPGPSGSSVLWTMRQQGLYLTGLYSIALMSLSMLLATRPAWLERPLGGMDRVYRLHKWSGILAIGFAAAHWLLEMSDDVLKATIGRAGRLPKEHYSAWFDALRHFGKDMGEWAIYAALAMLVLTLWKRFPYQIWRTLHRIMPAIYLTLAFHAAVLAPPGYWLQPVGLLLALLLTAGAISSALSLTGRIGQRRQVSGTVVSVCNSFTDITAVQCRLAPGWKGHRPGQFAFVTFNRSEGAHPFTIASADRGDRNITLQIKGLGDYTRGLAQRLQPGQAVSVEGPYGRFDLARRNPQAQQIWIAGGIGITPFLAWLESLQDQSDAAPAADLHYCTRDRASDSMIPKLEALCAALPGIRLHVHDARQGQLLTSEKLHALHAGAKRAEVWFCGPQGLADSIKEGLQRTFRSRLRFHQEAFEMR